MNISSCPFSNIFVNSSVNNSIDITDNKTRNKARNKTPCPFINTIMNINKFKEINTSNTDFMNAIKRLGIFDKISLFILEYLILKQFVESNGLINIHSINEHGVLEHDISLSRLDLAQGDNISFNKKHFAMCKKKSRDKKYLTLENFTEFRKDLISSRRNTRNFTYGMKELISGCVEDALLYLLFSDETKNIRIDWIEYFLVNAKFPYKLGFKLKSVSFIEIVNVTILQIIQMISNN
jgi:hypothetical protein